MKIKLSGNQPPTVAVDLSKLLDTRALITANSGGGKSWLLRLMIEQAAPSVQVIVIDREGEFASLRECVDMLLAGRDGEVPAQPKTANILARRLLELHVSCICDLSDLKRGEQCEFVRRFLEAMMSAPRSLQHPVLVVIDEADVFCPERSFGEADSTNAVVDLMCRGRKRGFCGMLATQRLAKLNKSAAAEAGNLFIGYTAQDVDQKRAGDTLGFSTEARRELRNLEPGEFFAMGRALDARGILQFRSGRPKSSHPEPGSRRAMSTPATPRALEGILSKLRDSLLPAEGEVLDLDDAKREIAQLRKQLATKTPVGDSSEQAALRKKVADLEAQCAKWVAALDSLESRISATLNSHAAGLQDSFRKVLTGLRDAQPAVNKPVPVMHTRKNARPVVVQRGGEAKLPKAENAILRVLAQFPEGCTSAKVAILTGYAVGGGGFNNAISALRRKAYIEGGRDNLVITESGHDAVGPVEPLPTGVSLVSHWQSQLGKAEASIIGALWMKGALSHECLAENTGYAPDGGGFNNAISKLRTLGLVEGGRKDKIRLSPVFMEVAA